MDQELNIINPLDYPSWNELVLSNPGYSFFHSSNWARVLCESYNYKPAYFTLVDKGSLKVLVPLMEIKSLLTGTRGVSLPFTDYCDPMVADDVNFEKVLEHIIRHGRRAGWKSFELRGGADLLQGEEPDAHYCEHTLRLSKDEKLIFSKFNSSTKRNVKKALRAGVKVQIASSLESIKAFYRLNCITRKKHGLPPQPYNFFKKIYEHVISKDQGFVVLASYEDKTVAGAVYFHLGRRAIYKYGASDERYQNLRANNLVMWEAIRWYCNNGYERFSFGRTKPENAGLKRFKEGWGAKTETVNYYRYDLKTNAFINGESLKAGFHNRVFDNMPIPLLRIIGALLYKHVG